MKNKQPSQRQLKVGEELRHLLSNILIRQKLRNPLVSGVSITITEVSVSADLKNATAFIIPLGGGDVKAILEGLKECKGYFKQEMSKNLRLRFIPELRFAYDKRYDDIMHIETILNKPEVARDLKNKNEEQAS